MIDLSMNNLCLLNGLFSEMLVMLVNKDCKFYQNKVMLAYQNFKILKIAFEWIVPPGQGDSPYLE